MPTHAIHCEGRVIIDRDMRIEATLAVSTATVQPEYHVDYIEYNVAGEPTLPSYTRGILTNTTDIVILNAPINNPRAEVIRLSIFNRDTVSTTMRIKTQDGLTSTERTIMNKIVATQETLHYQRGVGWYVTNS